MWQEPEDRVQLQSETKSFHLEQGEQVIAVVDRDLEEGEKHHSDNPNVEARLPSKEVGNGTRGGLG